MTKVFKWFTNLLFIVIIIMLVGYYLLRMTNNIQIYNVKTGSMENKIHVGDYILVVKNNDYKVGDIITYKYDKGFVTHRIIKKDGNKITTKGDANNTEDVAIDTSVIVGKVVFVGGLLNVVITYKFVFVGLLLSLYLFSCYFDSKKE